MRLNKNKHLERLDDFVTAAAAKGWIQLGEYFKLKNAVYALQEELGEEMIIEYG